MTLGREFTHVMVQQAGAESRLSLEEYATLPLSQQIRCVLEQRARFVDAEGAVIESREALAWLRARTATV